MDKPDKPNSKNISLSLDFVNSFKEANQNYDIQSTIIDRKYSSYPIANYQTYLRAKESPILSGINDDATVSIGVILAKRKELYSKRKKIADVMFLLSAFGIILMMIMVELLFSNPLNNKSVVDLNLGTKSESEFISQIIFILRCLISISTILLVFFIFVYHQIEIKLICINNHTNDPYTVITRQKICTIFLECCVCAVHPFPCSLDVKTESKITLIDESLIPVMPVPTIILLSVLMFLRVYQICRVIVFHSKLVENSSSQSLGYLNKIDLNFRFLFKTYMHSAPVVVLLFLVTTLFTASGWILMACEYPSNTRKFDYNNSLWLIAITFLTVGYGDIVPITSCGRFVSVFAAIMGGLWIALTVTFMTKKLEFTRGEKYFYKFVTEIELLKRFKNASADLLKRSWLNYRTKKYKSENIKEVLKNERLLEKSVREIRRLKEKARKYNDKGSMLSIELTDQVGDDRMPSYANLNVQINHLEKKVNKIEINIDLIGQKVNKIFDLLNK